MDCHQAQFASCLEAYERSRLRAEDLKRATADEKLELVSELRQQLTASDPIALAEEQSFWDLTLSELEMSADAGDVDFSAWS